MLDLFDFATDENLENGGAWKEIGGNTELLVARAGNRAYSKELTRLVELEKTVLDKEDDAADKKSDAIMIDVISKTVLLGWRTKQADGSYADTVLYRKKPLTYSAENAAKVLKWKDFRQRVVGIANDVSNYKLKEEAEQGEA